MPLRCHWKWSSARCKSGPSVSGSNVTVADTWLSAQNRCMREAIESCSHMETSPAVRTPSPASTGNSTTTAFASSLAGSTV